jgi:predicted kinase
MHGTLGSGKSTCAKKLTKILNAERIDIDAVLRDNKLDHQASDSACIPAKNFIKGLDIVIPLAKDLLKKNKIAIFDGCLYHKEVLDYLIEQLKFPNYTFTLKTKLETCIKRDQNRERTIGEGVAREVYDLVKENDFGIIINTDDKTVDETLKEIRDCLPT